MGISDPTVKKLVEKYKQISLLGKIGALLDWDMNVNLPLKASSGRAVQAAYITNLVADRWSDQEFRNLLKIAQTQQKSLSGEERTIVRNLNWHGKLYFKVPKEIIVEKARTSTEAFMVWQEARRKNNFADFLPYLHKIIHLNQIMAEHLGFVKHPYDALLDLFEPELKAATCRKLFEALRIQLTDLLKKIQKSSNYQTSDELVSGQFVYPLSSQKQLALFVLKKMGYDLEAGRIDVSTHPFETVLDRFDVRVTTRYSETDFRDSFTAAMHEAGHALYEQGVSSDYTDTPLEGGVSYAIHESQSRFWENQIGRDPHFIEFLTPIFQAFYPEQLSHIGSETLIHLFNLVKPSPVRVEADEVTYNLHIILRFELEEALIAGKIQAKDLPEVWRVKMEELLGITPKTDQEGVLQDVHWSLGAFGYFPTYTLGNLYAAQISHKVRGEIKVDSLLGRGELGTILSYLRENIHGYGSLYWPEELIKRVSGEKLDPKFFIEYLKEKYGQIYQLK